jgi:hypothetical protein
MFPDVIFTGRFDQAANGERRNHGRSRAAVAACALQQPWMTPRGASPMIANLRRLVRIAISLSLVTLVGAADARAGGQTRLIAGTNVAVRARPVSTADVVAYLTLGTEVADVSTADLEKTWTRVRLSDGREGWVLASLARPIDVRRRWPAIERLIGERLARRGDSFASLVELSDFTGRVAREAAASGDPEVAARLDLLRLRTLGGAAAAIPLRQDRRDPYLSWLDRHKASLVYDEPGGLWMVSPEATRASHKTHAGTAAADDIAWFGVTTGLPGECEGQLACYVVARNQLHGEYLRLHPDGRHAAEAVLAIRETVALVTRPGSPRESPQFERADCRDLVAAVDGLRAAVTSSGAGAESKDELLRGLGAIRGKCGQ